MKTMPGVGPVGKPAAQSADRGQEPHAVAAPEREQIDGGDDERQEQRDQHQLDRPAADPPVADPDVARRSLGDLEPLVERAEQLLRGAAHLHELRVAGQAPPVSPKADGGRLPPVVSVIAGTPRARNGPCS